MANETRGEVTCPHCGDTAKVRQNVKGKWYYSCPSCGLIQGTGKSFSVYILDHATLYGPDGEPEKETAPAEKPKPNIPAEKAKAATDAPITPAPKAPQSPPKAEKPVSTGAKVEPDKGGSVPFSWGFKQ